MGSLGVALVVPLVISLVGALGIRVDKIVRFWLRECRTALKYLPRRHNSVRGSVSIAIVWVLPPL